MDNLSDMIWIEQRKAIRSRIPLWTMVGSLFMPLGIAFLIFVSKNPEIAQQLGLVSAKANLVAYSAADWSTYLGLYGQIIAAGGFILFVMNTSWVFGREFTDGTLKDLLAVPVQRSSILLAKFIVVAAWSAVLTVVIYVVGLIMGAIINLPGASPGVFLHGTALVAVTACLVVAVVPPFAFFASVGRGYLLPIGVAILALMMANLIAVLGWGAYFPWGVPGMYASLAIKGTALEPVSFVLVLLTGAAGVYVTYLWWKYADQSK